MEEESVGGRRRKEQVGQQGSDSDDEMRAMFGSNG